jgi:hypothetical protein
MVSGRSPGDPPELLKPLIEFAFGDFAEPPLFQRRFPVCPGLSLHEDEFDIALYNGVRLVGFTQKLGASLDFIIRVGDLVPNNGVKVVEADFATSDADIRMQGHDDMPSVLFAGQTDIPYDADQPAAGDQDPEGFLPYFVDLQQENFIIVEMAELLRMDIVSFEIPIGRRRHYEMNGFIRNLRK